MITELAGCKFPFAFNAGKVMMSTDEQHIKEIVHHLITINKGEVLMQLDMGSNIYTRVFSPVNISALVAHDIRDALRSESRVQVNSVVSHTELDNPGVVFINVNFSYMEAYHQVSINYPLEEG